MITIIVTMCRLFSPIPEPLCHEVIAARLGESLQYCAQNAASIVYSPENLVLSSYKDKRWKVSRIACAPGDYEIKDAV